VPVPLIVLGAVALLLMAAGGAGFLARRLRLRKLQLASVAQPSDGHRRTTS
jgi:nitrate reductase gamma subunit